MLAARYSKENPWLLVSAVVIGKQTSYSMPVLEFVHVNVVHGV